MLCAARQNKYLCPEGAYSRSSRTQGAGCGGRGSLPPKSIFTLSPPFLINGILDLISDFPNLT
jgi:hypothetical protein